MSPLQSLSYDSVLSECDPYFMGSKQKSYKLIQDRHINSLRGQYRIALS